MDTLTNQVLTDDARRSKNFYTSDLILQHYIKKHLPKKSIKYIDNKLHFIGRQSANKIDSLSLKADKHRPILRKRSKFGEPVNNVQFHPAYFELLDIAVRSEMFYVQYNRGLRKRFIGNRHALGFIAGQIFAMSELGVYCPLCMTDGAAHLVDQFAPASIKKRLLPKLSARRGDELYTGAMFLTEKSGGSDVGRNLATAEAIDGMKYKLNGEKWFCSNVNADVIMTLARTGAVEKGTRGLSLFLVEKCLPDGSRNPMEIMRLKDKLGVRSMATGEVRFDDTIGILLGEKNKGFKLMAEMINISRTYNSVGAVAVTRRAIIEAYEYLNHRITFGKEATKHALIREKFHELGARYVGNFLLVWRAIRAMDGAEAGNESERQLMRMLVPMAKWKSAETGVYSVRECMELIGGNGYIEEFILPKLLRDVNVLPIWEGSGNIIVLDMLRAAQKSTGLKAIVHEIKDAANKWDKRGKNITSRVDNLLELMQQLQRSEERDIMEATAKPLFKELIYLYEIALMIKEKDEINSSWINPALNYMVSGLDSTLSKRKPISQHQMEALIAWEY